MEVYRIEMSRLSKIYELVTYKVLKTTEASFLCEERGFTRRIRIPRYDSLHMTFTDRKAGLLKLTQLLENLRIAKLEEAERALEAYEEACAELRGERILGYESIVRMDGCGREVDPYYMIAGDLRKHFPGVQANHDVATILKDNKVVTKDMTFDCESACFYAYWPATNSGLDQAKDFVDKFNVFLSERKAA